MYGVWSGAFENCTANGGINVNDNDGLHFVLSGMFRGSSGADHALSYNKNLKVLPSGIFSGIVNVWQTFEMYVCVERGAA